MTQIKSNGSESHGRIGHNSQRAISKSERELLEYLMSMTGELSYMARTADAEMIAYVFDMAATEINEVLEGKRPIDGGFGQTRRCQVMVSK